MNRLALVAYYSAGYQFLKDHSATQLASGPMEPWRQGQRILNYLDLEVTHLIAAMLLDGEGCAQVEDANDLSQRESIQ